MKRKIGVVIGIILIMLILVFGILYLVDLDRMAKNEPVLFSTWGRKYAPPVEKPTTSTKNMKLILSLEDEIAENSAWCGTFNLIWNDLKNDLAKQDIVFANQTELINNLNKGTFTAENLSESSYYKAYGIPSQELKEQIEKAIEEKFNEKSDILGDFDFENSTEYDYFLYCMLKKEFEFPTVYTVFENEKFKDSENVKCFGIDGKAEQEVRDALNAQSEIMYYDSNDSFAVKLYTKQNDEVIVVKGNNSKTFGKMYEDVIKRAEEYTGMRHFEIEENLKIPCIEFNLKEEIPEVEGQEFKFSDGRSYEIDKAVQTIQFKLDEKGGKVKSESGMLANLSAIVECYAEPRQFIIDDTFTVFLVEKDKKLPYFAAQISDISEVQANKD